MKKKILTMCAILCCTCAVFANNVFADTLNSEHWTLYTKDSTCVIHSTDTIRQCADLLAFTKYIKHVEVDEDAIFAQYQTDTFTCITIAQAKEIIAGLEAAAQTDVEYILQGQVQVVMTDASKIPGTYQNINFRLVDETGTLDCYYTCYLNNASFTSAVQVPVIGSKVIVKGKLQAFAKTDETSGETKITPEMVNGYFVKIEAGTLEPETITVAQAIELALALEPGGKSDIYYRCSGTVAYLMTSADKVPEIYTNINFELTDGTDTIACAYTNYLENAKFTSADQIPAVGTKVTVLGPLKNYAKNDTYTPEFQNAFFETIGDYTYIPHQEQDFCDQTVLSDLNTITWNAKNSGNFPFEFYWNTKAVNTVTFGEKVETIPDSLCRDMSGIQQIVSKAATPPVCGVHTFDSVSRSTPLYVPAGSVELYKQAAVWREFYNIDTIAISDDEPSEEPTDSVQIQTTETTALFVWPTVENAYSYSLIIWANAEQTEKVCTITLNSNGQLTGIDFSKAPSKESKEENAGLNFNVTGLEPGTTYAYTLDALDENGAIIDRKTGTFLTEGATAVENIQIAGLYAENGRIVCENAEDMRIYTVTGIDVTSENGHLQGVYIVKCGDKTTKLVVK